MPYEDEFTVLVSVSIDSLKQFSKLKVSKDRMLDRTNIDIINSINTKNEILKSLSSIFDSVLNKFLLDILVGFTILYISL